MTNNSMVFSDFSNKCFVCGKHLQDVKRKNSTTNLPVCEDCQGTEAEKQKEQEAIDSLGDGFVCGCI